MPVRYKLAVGVLVLLSTSACGASSEDLRHAKAATYVDSPRSVFARAVAATRERYEVGAIDCSSLELVTNERTYDADGEVLTPGVRGSGGYGNYVTPGGPVSFYTVDFHIRVVRTTDQHVSVKVSPRVWSARTPTDFVVDTDETDDASFPSFARGRADALRLQIYDYETQGLRAPDPCPAVAAGRGEN
jgi:hypothetical protein